MKTLMGSLGLCLALLLVATVPACKVEAPEELPFSCATEEDCGGDGFKCVASASGSRYCCLPAAESCNGRDDDCDGSVDELDDEPCYDGLAETRGVGACRAGKSACGPDNTVYCAGQVKPAALESCNGVDDDCDGAVDEGFDLQTDNANCGKCGNTCAATDVCTLGQCVRRLETACSDGDDNDGDGAVDCEDSDCRDLSCGEGRVCMLSGACGEGVCDNGADDDADGKTDCEDSDCDTKSCGTGCVCSGGAAVETVCDDNEDNDGDGDKDCKDGDCTSCGTSCACVGGVKVEQDCSDNADNDDDGTRDCEDSDCDTKSCGTGCVCSGGAAVETVCGDNEDNDGDGKTDCADSDCELKSPGISALICYQGVVQEIACTGGVDDDGDGLTDCVSGSAEPNCVDGVCGAGCAILSCTRHETDCADGVNNDGNNGTDCADTADCNGKSCGAGCICATSNGNGIRKETDCQDLVDNDGNNGVDCEDSVDCPTNTVCTRIVNGSRVAGTCRPNRTCG